ncbi:hypothetical protein [Caldimonas tepidiphila]|uniref:hypothetical protein n=1 Tax=Caldimonas tepidiphila TaxID=2315841 RepID=UPI000E5A3F48|nr:hypothetical protein [Caldimonas tepidiphila]
MPTILPDVIDDKDAVDAVHEARLWRDKGWTARVIKNEEDDGWAVSMTKDGESEPAFVCPWTMGRDKKNPKPLDVAAFNTLVKSASEVVRRHEQHLQAMYHKSVAIGAGNVKIFVTLDIVPDEFEPYADLTARDDAGELLATVRVAPDFKFTTASATDWIRSGYRKPRP